MACRARRCASPPDRPRRVWTLPHAAALLAVAAVVVVAPADARAQTPSASETALSRELFQQGLAAAREGRWVQAREAFARAYALVPRPAVLLDLANAQVHTGQLVRGADSYRRFLREAAEAPVASYRAAAESALREVEALLAHARVAVPGLRADDQLRIDGEPVSHAAVGAALPLDPGAHRLELARPGAAHPAVAEFALRAGETREVRLEPPAVAAVIAPPVATSSARAPALRVVSRPPHAPSSPRPSVLASPWLWAGVGVLVVGAVAAGVAIGLANGADSGPTGTFVPGAVTVHY